MTSGNVSPREAIKPPLSEAVCYFEGLVQYKNVCYSVFRVIEQVTLKIIFF